MTSVLSSFPLRYFPRDCFRPVRDILDRFAELDDAFSVKNDCLALQTGSFVLQKALIVSFVRS